MCLGHMGEKVLHVVCRRALLDEYNISKADFLSILCLANTSVCHLMLLLIKVKLFLTGDSTYLAEQHLIDNLVQIVFRTPT